MVPWVKNLTAVAQGAVEGMGLSPGLAQWVKGSGAAEDLIQSLAQGLQYIAFKKRKKGVTCLNGFVQCVALSCIYCYF